MRLAAIVCKVGKNALSRRRVRVRSPLTLPSKPSQINHLDNMAEMVTKPEIVLVSVVVAVFSVSFGAH